MQILNRAMDFEQIRITAEPDACARSAIVAQVTQTLHANEDAADIAAILSSSEVSPDDVVREFGTTQALAASVVGMIADWMLAPLGRPCEDSFREQLIEFAHRATDEYVGLRLRNLYRIAVGEGARDVGIRNELYRNGPQRMQGELARFFDSARTAGVSLHDDSQRLAVCFIALLRTRWDPLSLSGATDTSPTESEIVDLIDTFLTGVGAVAGDA